MFTDALILIAGFSLLIKGANFLVTGSSRLAQKVGISPLIVGLTIVAFGTSAPEFIVNIIASVKGSSGLIVGNIVGSNISNIGLIVGITALIAPLKIRLSTITREIPLMLLSALVLFALVADSLWGGSQANILSRNDGLVLLLVFSIFVYYLGIQIRRQNKDNKIIEKEYKDKAQERLKVLQEEVIGLKKLVASK